MKEKLKTPYNDAVNRALKENDCSDLAQRYKSGEISSEDLCNRMNDFFDSLNSMKSELEIFS